MKWAENLHKKFSNDRNVRIYPNCRRDDQWEPAVDWLILGHTHTTTVERGIRSKATNKEITKHPHEEQEEELKRQKFNKAGG